MRIILFFDLGSDDRTRKRARHVVGTSVIETLGRDQLGKPSWSEISHAGRGGESTMISRLVQAALVKVFAQPFALVRVGNRIYPDGVSKTDDGIEIEVAL